MVSRSVRVFGRLATLVSLVSAVAAADPNPKLTAVDRQLEGGPVTRALVVRTALARSPALQAARSRNNALVFESRAEGKLPAPELMLDVWQVPLSTPARLDRAGMIMLGLRQNIPAPGSLGARSDARASVAGGAAAETRVLANALSQSVGHAYVDYAAATALHRLHADHFAVLERSEAVARTRVAGGASLGDVLSVQAESARIQVEVTSERTNIEAARIRLNTLMARPQNARLGEPEWREIGDVSADRARLLALAEHERPELALRESERTARRAEERAARSEASWPEFSVSALYFAPTDGMPQHGYGVAGSMSLPWLWGPARATRDARRWEVAAANDEIRQTRLDIEQDVAAALAHVQSSAERVRLLTTLARPATQRLRDTMRAAYVSGAGTMQALLEAERAVVDVEIQLIAMRADFEHAVVDLEWSTGGKLAAPRPAARAVAP